MINDNIHPIDPTSFRIPTESEDAISEVVRNTEARTAYDRAYANGWNDCNSAWINAIKALPSAQPESTRTFVELLVMYPDPELCAYKEYKGKPYYSIKYIENGETYVGYGTYNPKVLSQYLKEYFMPSTQPEILECKDCKHRGREGKPIADGRYWCGLHDAFMYYCSDAERETNNA